LECVCIVEANGNIVKETKVESHPDALVAVFNDLRLPMARIGLEAGRCSSGSMSIVKTDPKERIAEAMLYARAGLLIQFNKLDKAVRSIDRYDKVCQQLMTVPSAGPSRPNGPILRLFCEQDENASIPVVELRTSRCYRSSRARPQTQSDRGPGVPIAPERAIVPAAVQDQAFGCPQPGPVLTAAGDGARIQRLMAPPGSNQRMIERKRARDVTRRPCSPEVPVTGTELVKPQHGQ
jgi:hypothetical protein